MADQTPESVPPPVSLPENPSLDWLRKQAKRRLAEQRKSDPAAKLAGAQFDLAKQYGFPSWRALKAHIESLTLDGQVADAARGEDSNKLMALLDQHPDKLQARYGPYQQTLLHLAAASGRFANVDELLRRGLDVNAREKGDNTYAMHWAAAVGAPDIVRRLADAGGDVIGHGDDHALEVIGWATCWDGCDDAAHRAVVDVLLARGARHHIYSAIAMQLDAEVRRIVADNPRALVQPLSRNEDFQLPLHFAVRTNRPRMVALLLELGADPLGTDASGYPAAAYALRPDVDRPVMEALRSQGRMDLFTALALGEWDAADRLLRDDPGLVRPGGASAGVLHLAAKRGDTATAEWLLRHGVSPDVRWSHWGAEVTPLHLAVMGNHPEVARLLLEFGADPGIHDSMHDSDALGWAEFFRRADIVAMIKAHGAGS